MIGRFQSNNRIKIKVKGEFNKHWTHLKDGLSGSEDIRSETHVPYCDLLLRFLNP